MASTSGAFAARSNSCDANASRGFPALAACLTSFWRALFERRIFRASGGVEMDAMKEISLRESHRINYLRRGPKSQSVRIRFAPPIGYNPPMPAPAGHYQAAFEAYLRKRSIPFVSVAQAKKALFAKAKLKSFDFVVYSQKGPNRLIDIKGRVCKTGARFETWATEEDVADLAQWEQVFGEEFKGLLAFVYWVPTPNVQGPGMFVFHDRTYLMMGVDLAQYRQRMRRRSAKWETVALPTKDFRSLARPLETWL